MAPLKKTNKQTTKKKTPYSRPLKKHNVVWTNTPTGYTVTNKTKGTIKEYKVENGVSTLVATKLFTEGGRSRRNRSNRRNRRTKRK